MIQEQTPSAALDAPLAFSGEKSGSSKSGLIALKLPAGTVSAAI
jgi:hypothetical protein